MFEEVIGGGEIYGPYGPYRGQMGSNPRYYWAIRGHEAVDRVFTMLQPWLSDRRMSQGVQVLARG
jgi:hypothetical protein